MRRLSVLPLLTIVSACSQGAPEPAPPAGPAAVAVEVVGDPTAIPARFRGEWNADLAACGTSRNETRLMLGAREVAFHESSGAVRNVAQPAPDRLAATFTLTGEGESWEARHDFSLSSDGATLTDMAGGLVRHRCP